MKQPVSIAAILALAFVVLGIVSAIVIIYGIWVGFGDPVIGKSIATLLVLFILTGILHAVARGMDEKPKKKD